MWGPRGRDSILHPTRQSSVIAVVLLLLLGPAYMAPATMAAPEVTGSISFYAEVTPHGEPIGRPPPMIDLNAYAVCEAPFIPPLTHDIPIELWVQIGHQDIEVYFHSEEHLWIPYNECLIEDQEYSLNLDLQIVVPATAAPFEPIPIELYVTHEGEHHLLAAWEEQTGIIAYWQVDVTLDEPVFKDHPAHGQILARSLNNIPIELTLEPEHGPRLGTLDFPETVILEPVRMGQHRDTKTTFTYTPTRTGQENFRLEITATHPYGNDPDLGGTKSLMRFTAWKDIEEYSLSQNDGPHTQGRAGAPADEGSFFTQVLTIFAIGAILFFLWRHNSEQRRRRTAARLYQEKYEPLVEPSPVPATQKETPSQRHPLKGAYSIRKSRSPRT